MSTDRSAEGGSPLHGSDDAPTEVHPYRGEELGGATATVCPGFDPDPIRYLLYQPAMRILLIFWLIVTLLGVACFAGGSALAGSGSWMLKILAFLLYGLVALLFVIDLLVVAMMVMGFSATARYFKNALLTPGVVVSEKPLAVVILAPLGNGSGPEYHGLQRLSLSSLPYHASSPGTRVPAVSAFLPAEGLDRWLAFSPELICWGTGRRDRIEQCFHRLGTADFDRLDACVARGLIPTDDDALILLDAAYNELATLSIKAERAKYEKPTS